MKENKTLQRYEFKYFLAKEIAGEIKEHASKFMILDKYANCELNNRYLVRSIYFEDNFNSNFDEKVNGYRIRKKFRLRYYNKNINVGPVFLETKGRNLERTYKRRVKINLSNKECFEIANLLLGARSSTFSNCWRASFFLSFSTNHSPYNSKDGFTIFGGP